MNKFLGLNRSFYFDVCKLKPNFEKQNDFDGELEPYTPGINYNNFPWGDASTHLPRMAEKFVDEQQSFIAVCNVKSNEKKYFCDWIDSFAKQVDLPPMAFGGYGERKLDHGVLILYLLQPEWWDYLDHRRR